MIDDLGAVQGATTLNEKHKPAGTEEEYKRRCTEMTEAIKTLRKYNKECFSSLTQQVFSAILRTRGQMIEAHCAEGQTKEAFEAMKCVRDEAFESVKQAERKTIVGAQVILDANIQDEKLRTKRACCAVLAGKKLFLNATKEKCSKYEKHYVDYVDSYTSEAMGLICPEADKLGCEQLEPLKLEGVEPRNSFFLNPTIKLVKTLDH